jgi:hypothetical protein
MRLVRNNESSSQPVQTVLLESLSKLFNQTGENAEEVRAATRQRSLTRVSL